MVFATKNYTVRTYTARFVVAQFIVRLWLEGVPLATGSRNQEIVPQ